MLYGEKLRTILERYTYYRDDQVDHALIADLADDIGGLIEAVETAARREERERCATELERYVELADDIGPTASDAKRIYEHASGAIRALGDEEESQ